MGNFMVSGGFFSLGPNVVDNHDNGYDVGKSNAIFTTHDWEMVHIPPIYSENGG